MSNPDPIPPNIDGQQIYMNSQPQYDPKLSYHGYDLSRDLSEYRFGEDNSDSRDASVTVSIQKLADY